jgi:hypothetical protein
MVFSGWIVYIYLFPQIFFQRAMKLFVDTFFVTMDRDQGIKHNETNITATSSINKVGQI